MSLQSFQHTKEMILRTIFLVVHLLCAVAAILPHIIEGIDEIIELSCFAAVLFPLTIFVQRRLYALASLLTISTLCHVMSTICHFYPDTCPSAGIDWKAPTNVLFLFSVFHLLTYVAVSKLELEVIFPVLQLAALLSIQSETVKMTCLLLAVGICLARTLASFNSYHSEDLVLFLVATGCASVFEIIELRALFTVFFALTFAASVDVKKREEGSMHFLGLLGSDGTAFLPLQREDI